MSLICLCLFVVGIQVELDAVDVYLALPASVFPFACQTRPTSRDHLHPATQSLFSAILGAGPGKQGKRSSCAGGFRERSGSANCSLDIFRKDSVSSGQRKRQLGFTPQIALEVRTLVLAGLEILKKHLFPRLQRNPFVDAL